VTSEIRADNLGVRFLLDRQRRPVTPTLARLRRRVSEIWALRGASLSIGPGEAVALLGPSGAGKTTLLRAMAGVLPADAGRLEVRGRVGALLSTGAGVFGLLSGRENAFLLGVLGGLSAVESRAAVESVKDKTGLGEAFERPVSGYSAGMRARLGFVAADNAFTRILLLDEVHEALDHEFRERVQRRARQIVESGGIVVVAGHDHAILEQLCPRAVLLREGKVQADGDFETVRRAYLD
jgi:ABC-type polysaccharide/polyol phosphate transport system ATPase subunit